jgi:hypothetical protein
MGIFLEVYFYFNRVGDRVSDRYYIEIDGKQCLSLLKFLTITDKPWIPNCTSHLHKNRYKKFDIRSSTIKRQT